MAEKHQYMQALNYTSNSDFLYSNLAYCDKDVEVYNEKLYSKYLVEHLREKYTTNQHTFIVESTIYRGISYKVGMHLCYTKNEFGEFLLLKIKYIFINENMQDLIFVGNKITVCYDSELGLYIEQSIEQNLGNQYENNLLISVSSENLNLIEPILKTRKNNENLYYFPSCPLNF